MFEKLSRKNVRFSQLPQTEDCESLVSTSESQSSDCPMTSIRSKLWSYWIPLLWLVSTAITLTLGIWLGISHVGGLDNVCTKHVIKGSPLLDGLDMSYEIVTFNGSLFQENVYRQSAGPEVDVAWQALGVDYRIAVVPQRLAEISGLSEDMVQVNDKYGGGFPANVEGLHQLHCLNLLRQSLFYNYDYYRKMGEGAFINDDKILRFHVSHCLDILRQQLMCTVDIGVLGQVWWNKKDPTPYPDFNTQHKCRNFELVRQWAEDHQVPKDIPKDFIAMPKDPEYVMETLP